MPATSPFGIFFPDDTMPISPIESLFSQMATSVNTQLAALRGGIDIAVADAAARDALYPSPSGSNRVYRADKLYSEFPFAGQWFPTIARPFIFLTGSWNIPTSTGFSLLGTTYPWSEQSDRMGWHDAVVNTSRITPNIGGAYRITVTMRWAGNGADQRILRIAVNGTEVANQRDASLNAGVPAGATTTVTRYLNGTTDYFEVQQYQNSGATLATSCDVTVEYMGP